MHFFVIFSAEDFFLSHKKGNFAPRNKKETINTSTMTKSEIVALVSQKTGIDKTTLLIAIEAYIETIKNKLEEGDNVFLRGFGTFALKKRATKTGRNISKNTTIIIPEHSIPFFYPSKDFMNLVKDTKDIKPLKNKRTPNKK